MLEALPTARGSPPVAEREPPDVARVLLILALAIFATSLFMRIVDPVIPRIAGDLGMDTATVALLSTGYTLPYALVQPLFGSLADMFGKTRLLKIALLTTAFAGLAGAGAPDFPVLLGSRILTGIVSGGIFPISLALAGDLVPVERRQIAFGRLLAAAMLGNLLGSPLAGIIADTVGWRGVFVLMSTLALVALAAAQVGLRTPAAARRAALDLRSVARGYRAVLRNPLSKVCYGSVFLEGVFLFGLLPYIAALLALRGEQRAAIAGLVLGGFAIGGFVYAASVARVLGRFGETRLMCSGGIFMGLGLLFVALGLPWQAEFVALMLTGLGFYSLHGVIQIYVTELAPASRGLAMALHSAAFFLGQAAGPVVYRYGFAHAGVVAMNAIAAVVLVGVGVLCAARLRRPEESDIAGNS